MNLDDELRATFADWAEQAPTGDALLTAVYARSHRLTVRRRYQTALLAAVAVLAVLLPIGLLLHGGVGRSTPLPPSNPTLSAPVSAGALTAHVVLARATAQPRLPDFPLLVGWLPGWIQLRSTFDAARGVGLEDREHGLYLLVAPDADYDWLWQPAEVTDTDVNGATATLRSGVSADQVTVGVSWRLAGVGWVTVDSQAGISAADILRIARSLAPGSTPAQPRFAFGFVPVDFTLSYFDTDSACWSPLGWQAPGHGRGLCVTISPPNVTDNGGGQLEVLSGQAGMLRREAWGTRFLVGLQDGRQLEVSVSAIAQPDEPRYGAIEMTDALLGEFTKNITVLY